MTAAADTQVTLELRIACSGPDRRLRELVDRVRVALPKDARLVAACEIRELSSTPARVVSW